MIESMLDEQITIYEIGLDEYWIDESMNENMNENINEWMNEGKEEASIYHCLNLVSIYLDIFHRFRDANQVS